MRTMKDLAQRALDVQAACNLSGVVISFADDIRDLRKILQAEGTCSTDTVNTHPMCVLYSTQIAFLSGTSATGCERSEEWSKAYNWALNESKG